MPRMTKNQRLIHALETNPRLLKIQIKGYEAEIRGIEFSLDFALKHPDPYFSAEHHENYLRTCREKLELTKGFLVEKQMQLALALLPPV